MAAAPYKDSARPYTDFSFSKFSTERSLPPDDLGALFGLAIPDFSREFRSRCFDLSNQYQEFLADEFPGECISDSLQTLSRFFSQNQKSIQTWPPAVSFFTDCFVHCGVLSTLHAMVEGSKAGETPFIGQALHFMVLISSIGNEFATLFEGRDFISPLLSLVLADAFISERDFENALRGILNLLESRNVVSLQLEAFMNCLDRLRSVCQSHSLQGYFLPRFVLKAVKIGVGSEDYPRLASMLSQLVSECNYAQIALAYFHMVAFDANFAVSLTRLGFLGHLLEQTDTLEIPHLREAAMVARMTYVRLGELPECDDLNSLRESILSAIPWHRVREEFDSSDPHDVVRALELVRDTAPASIEALQAVKSEPERRLIENVFLPILSDGNFAEKCAVLSLFLKLVNISLPAMSVLYWEESLALLSDALFSDAPALMHSALDLITELLRHPDAYPRAHRGFVDALTRGEIGAILAGISAGEHEDLSAKARFIRWRLQAEVSHPFGQDIEDVMAGYS
jgi:hypothetical protein